MPIEHIIVCSHVPMICSACPPGVKSSTMDYFRKTDATITQLKCNPHKKTLSIAFTTPEDKPTELYAKELKEQLDPAWWDDTTEMTVNGSLAESAPISLKILISKGTVGLVTGIGILALPFFLSLSMLGMSVMIGAGAIITTYLGIPVIREGVYRAFAKKKLNMDSLFFISGFSALASSIIHLFFPAAPMLIEVGALIFGFRYWSEAIKSSLYQASTKEQFIDLLKPNWKTFGNPQNLRNLKLDQIILIEPGDRLPVNGTAACPIMLETSAVNGQINMKLYPEDSELPQGATYRGENSVWFTCKQVYENSYFDQMDQAVEESETSEATIQMRTQRFLNYFIPIVLLIAIALAATCYFLLSPTAAIKASLYVLASACPCIFGLIPSLGMYIGVQKCRELSVSINDNAALETLSTINTFVFDVNGTLTTGENNVTACTINPSHWKRIAELQASSEHSIAKAIFNYCKKNAGLENVIPAQPQKEDNEHRGLHDGEYYIGNPHYLRKHGFLIEETDINTNELSQKIYVGHGGQLLGFFEITEPLQERAKETLETLKNLGKTCILYSGAPEHIVAKISEKLGKISYFANMSPKNKEEAITRFPPGTVSMLGDGINDFPAMLKSLGIGIASPVSHNVALNKTKITLPAGQIHQIIPTLAVAQDTQYQIYKNLGMSLGYNVLSLIFVVLALYYIEDFLNPAIGAGIMVTQSACALGSLWYWQRQSVPSEQHQFNQQVVLSSK